MRDLGIVFFSIIVAVLLAKTGALKEFLAMTAGTKYLSSFLAGIFFVSVFTVAPAAVVLVEAAQTNSILLVAFFGGLGALIGDLIIFRFVRDSLSESLADIFLHYQEHRIIKFLKSGPMRFLSPIIGALIVISPFPDEIGLALMGMTKMKTALFVPLAFTLNFLGILAISSIFK